MLAKSFLGKITSIRSPATFKSAKRFTSDSAYFSIQQDIHNDYAILKMNRAPVNSFDLEFVTDLSYQIDIFEKRNDLNGIILTSDISHSFSAGIDIMQLYQSKPAHLKKIWLGIQNLWKKLYQSDKVYIAAMNGHSLALGLQLAMSCDYRIMADDESYKIGLSAVLLGINPPSWIKDTMINTIGFREAEFALQTGKYYDPQSALKIKLVDELCNEKDLMKIAEERMKLWCKIPSEARSITKKMIRQKTVDKFTLNQIEDMKMFVDSVSSNYVQESLENYLIELKKKHKYL